VGYDASGCATPWFRLRFRGNGHWPGHLLTDRYLTRAQAWSGAHRNMPRTSPKMEGQAEFADGECADSRRRFPQKMRPQ
jgi:hypothetical protein